ncbi:BON domain-containing protein [Photobacterium sanguinicancri]|uniref:BON domain-containing protein n=1 Tax=Photobacterium sanguinicancri TaxID=875932 RepID=A0AAW7Y8I2_9GAMM|nr:BON domain-containing protein [Photobacterium sanguinicancri]KXI23260.1 hemolysin [Photobacterium sanguinicancri]MDO6544061.1 BON domain-containing protein [Photobacterium sanguinicancri]OZS43915.1 BON domain-containing protein [Photobacterium sanguinicancri]
MTAWRVCLMAVCLWFVQGCAGITDADPRGAKQQWFDKEIEMEVAGMVNKPPFRQQARINVVSYDGNVLLIGQATKQEVANQLEQAIKQLTNVNAVYNQVRIRALPDLGEVSKDSWLTTKVKSMMVGSKQLKDASIKVITENQEVFLLGYVTQEQANIATDIARNVDGVKQVIKVFEYPDQ